MTDVAASRRSQNAREEQKSKENIDLMFRQIKAEQLGVHVDELVGSHADGKRVYVAKQTKSNSSKRNRSRVVRGTGSLIEEINLRLSDSEELVKDLESKKQILGMDSYDFLDQLGIIAEKIESGIHPLFDLEEVIERKKRDIADYDKYHRVFIDIQKFRQSGDIRSAEDLERKQEAEFREFRFVYRALVPLLNQACELRLNLLREKRRLMNLQYNLMRKFLSWQVDLFHEMLESSHCDPAQCQVYTDNLNTWKRIPEFVFSNWKQGISLSRQVAILEKDIEKLSDQVDDVLPKASDFIYRIHVLLQEQLEKGIPS